jgi:hypothetical protein
MHIYSFCLLLLAASAVLQAQQKPTMAVLKLKNGAEITDGEAEIISDRLRVEIFKTGKVEIMEREQMETILKEQGFQASGACTDDGCMVQMGQLLGVQSLIAGSIGKLGSLFLVNTRGVNVQTGKIEKVVSVDIKGSIEDVVDELPRIARQLTSSDSAQPIVVYNENKSPAAQPADSGDSADETIVKPSEVECNADVVLEAVNFSGKIAFKLAGDNTEEIHENLSDAINEFFDREVKVVRASQMSQLAPDCNAPVVRVQLDAYSSGPGGMGQYVGTAQASLLFFENARSSQPGATITIREKGDRHWGDAQPFVNAFEAIADRLEDQLSKSGYLKDLRKRLNKR